MPVTEAEAFFADGEAATPAAHKILDRLADVGLGYLSLGQPLPTLSGGERQRLKLATHLAEKGGVYVLDEPTSGLHLADVEQLLGLLDRLVDSGKSVIVIEHHQAVMAHADWIIDLGPGAGHDGGRIVFEGTPADLVAAPLHPHRRAPRGLRRHLTADERASVTARAPTPPLSRRRAADQACAVRRAALSSRERSRSLRWVQVDMPRSSARTRSRSSATACPRRRVALAAARRGTRRRGAPRLGVRADTDERAAVDRGGAPGTRARPSPCRRCRCAVAEHRVDGELVPARHNVEPRGAGASCPPRDRRASASERIVRTARAGGGRSDASSALRPWLDRTHDRAAPTPSPHTGRMLYE